MLETLYDSWSLIPWTAPLLCVLLAILHQWYVTSVECYWIRRGIKSSKLQPVLKSLFFPPKQTKGYDYMENYKKLGRIHGYFDKSILTGRPCLVVGEPSVLRNICLTDFSVLPGRGYMEMPDRLQNLMLIYLSHEPWKRIRSIVSPTFTTGKIKRFLSIFQDSSKTVVQNFKNAVEKGERIEVKRFFGAFTLDVIASASFSRKIDSHNNPDSMFAKSAASYTRIRPLILFLYELLPLKIVRMIYNFTTKEIDFFKRIIHDIIEERRSTGKKKNDFLQLVIDAAAIKLEEEKSEKQSKDIGDGFIPEDEKNSFIKSTNNKKLTEDEVIAQCLLFILAGYHSTAVVISFAAFRLAHNGDVQERAYQEISEILKETDGELTYDALQKMDILDNIIAEILRLYPPFLHLTRKAEAEYKLADTKITVPKGMFIDIPIYAMHHDPDLFPDPERFDPDRFTPERKAKMIPYSYMPFGAGPRSCIGMRFALIEIKVVLAYIITNLRLKPSPEMPTVNIHFQRLGPIMYPSDIVVQMEIRKDCPLKD